MIRTYVGKPIATTLSILLAMAWLPLAVIPQVAYASTTSYLAGVSATLGSQPTCDGLRARVGDASSTPRVVTRDGISSWQTDLAANNDYIYLAIANPAELRSLEILTFHLGPIAYGHLMLRSIQ